MKEEDSYKPNETAFYHESGEVDKVKIIENNSNDNCIVYDLEVIEVIKESSMAKPSTLGETFSCTKQRKSSGYGGLWYLLDHE